jgi:DNA repair exonuclease SbcCD nuclease subunit
VLKLLHTADWHLGRRFPTFPEEGQKKLSRARMDVVVRILEVARRNAVHAILCAGDIFDEPNPQEDFWQGLVKILRNHSSTQAPLFLVPGNHDPLTSDSVWAPNHPFRAQLPGWVHVVDRDDFTYELSPSAVLYARPCRSKAGESDLAMALPARQPGDERLRIGCVHGNTFDIEGYQTNFPIARDAGVARGLDYLAIGDTHSFRDVTSNLPVPTVYPGAPEPATFDDNNAGHVAVVAMFRRGLRPRVDAERVAFWRWRDVRCRDMNDLRDLLSTADLDRCVLRLRFDMAVSLAENSAVGKILRDLRGTEAAHGRAGILVEDRSGLRLRAGTAADFSQNLPPVLKDTVDRLDLLIASAPLEAEKEKARRALSHLFEMLATREATGGGA